MTTARFALAGIALVLVFNSPVARAVPPPTATVEYWIHADPNDAESAVTTTILLDMSSVDSVGDVVAWHIDQVRFERTKPGAEGVWTKTNPPVATSDGLWWVSHVDPAHPQSEEFVELPKLIGSAGPADPNDPKLVYTVQSTVSSPASTPFEITTRLNYALVKDEPGGTPDDGDDEPVEVPRRPTGGN